MRYFKFNNSRSEKNPYYVFIQQDEKGDFKDIFGRRWALSSRAHRTPITQEEFQAAQLQSSAALNVEIQPGDWMVSNEFPHKRIRAAERETPNSGYGHIRVDSIPLLTNHTHE